MKFLAAGMLLGSVYNFSIFTQKDLAFESIMTLGTSIFWLSVLFYEYAFRKDIK
jgi:hypothetical protein